MRSWDGRTTRADRGRWSSALDAAPDPRGLKEASRRVRHHHPQISPTRARTIGIGPPSSSRCGHPDVPDAVRGWGQNSNPDKEAVVAIAKNPPFDGDPGVEGPWRRRSRRPPLEAGAGKRKRGGGPRTAEGKQISSRNATEARDPVTEPDRRRREAEDWEEHLAGMRLSLAPRGHLEDSLVHQLAMNRWQRHRLDRWHDDQVRLQIEGASLQTRDALELAHDSLPKDERPGAATTLRPSWPCWTR